MRGSIHFQVSRRTFVAAWHLCARLRLRSASRCAPRLAWCCRPLAWPVAGSQLCWRATHGPIWRPGFTFRGLLCCAGVLSCLASNVVAILPLPVVAVEGTFVTGVSCCTRCGSRSVLRVAPALLPFQFRCLGLARAFVPVSYCRIYDCGCIFIPVIQAPLWLRLAPPSGVPLPPQLRHQGFFQ